MGRHTGRRVLQHDDLPRGLGVPGRVERFAGEDVPFLACRDLAVFKAFFDRTKDWADLEEMDAAGALDVEIVLGVLVRHLGADDHRIERVRRLALGPGTMER